MKRRASIRVGMATVGLLLGTLGISSVASATSASQPNTRVTVDQNGDYMSADQIGGTGTYTDNVLATCSNDRRMQNEPTLAIDPRDPSIWASGSNDYCTVETVHDAWAGFYRSTDSGTTWTDSLLPGYAGDTSSQGTASPLHPLVQGGAIAAGDPQMSWDGQGDLFYMGNNFNRGQPNGGSGRFRNNTGSIWVATYAPPPNATDNSTDGSRYVRTVLLATNTFGQGSFNDKTDLLADPANGNVYAAWSDFHGSGCNQILFSRSTDHGVTFSPPMKLSSGICGNQGPSMAIGPDHQIYIGWEGTTGGSFAQAPGSVHGAAFAVSTDQGRTFSKARFAVLYPAFVSEQFSGNGARECGDSPFNCPTGFTFPRFDLAGPYLAADNTHDTVVMGYQTAMTSGQGQIAYVVSTDGGQKWSAQNLLAPSDTGHQFYPWLTASNGRVSAVWYDSQGDPDYLPTRPPCNNGAGQTTACLNVRYAESLDGGVTWEQSIQVTDTPTNPNLEQFGGRLVPFFGDYITVAAQGDTIGAVWTDQRNAVTAPDPDGDNDGADVAGSPETGGTCTSSFTDCFDLTGGLDQNIYSALITP